MQDWITKLDDFLRLSERDILTHAGKISHDAATKHAHTEFETYKQHQIAQPSTVEKDFENSLKKLDSIESSVGKKKRGK